MFEVNTTSVPSAARTVAGNSATLRNNGFSRHLFYISATVVGGSVTVTIERQSPISLAWVPVLSSPAIAAPGESVLQIGPDFAAAANVAADTLLGANYRVSWAITTGATFSVAIYSQ